MCEDMSATTGTSRPICAGGLEVVLDAADGLVGAHVHVGRVLRHFHSDDCAGT
jgi:hypothetical protein